MEKQGSLRRRHNKRTAILITLGSVMLMGIAGCGMVKLPWSSPASKAASPPPAAAPVAATTASTVVPVASAPSAVPADTGDTVDEVVASVDGTPITSHDVEAFMASGGAGSFGGQPVASSAPPDAAAALKQLITLKMLDDETKKYADKVDDAHVDQYIQTLEQQNHITDTQLRAQLQAQGLSYDQFRSNVRRQIEVLTMIDREIRQKIVVSQAQIAAYYKDHQSDFTISQEKYELAQILVAVPAGATPAQVEAARAKAENIHKKLVGGADFASMAQQYSDDDSKSKGGELGYFSPDELNDQVEAAIKNLKPGQISEVVRTKYGFHIVKLEQHQQPGVRTLDQVKDEIRDSLMTEKARAQFQKWVDQSLVKQHYVEIMNN
jgi:parvulin-like peptidyl-prolyl isomerase